MLNLFWYDDGLNHVVGTPSNIFALTGYLDKMGIKFKVSDGSVYLSQTNFGKGGYKNWLGPNEQFS